jgi:hypothetical protein
LQNSGVAYQEDREPVQNAIVFKVSETIEPSTWDALDEAFDELTLQDQMQMEEELEDDTAASAAGLYLQLANGTQTIAKVDPNVVNRILSVLSVQELNEFLEVIVSSVESPDASAICRTH